MEEQLKKCSRCRIDKDLLEFYPEKHGKFGRMSRCKCCHKELTEEISARNREIAATVPPDSKQTCIMCFEEKPLVFFHKSKNRKSGRVSICKDCTRLIKQEEYKNNPEPYKKKAKEWSKKYPEKRTQQHNDWRIKHPKRSMVITAKHRAEKLGLPFDLVEDDFEIPTHCPVFGIKLEPGFGTGGPIWSSPSLDKRIPRLGYVPGNVEVLSHRANVIKRDATLDELIMLGEWAKNKKTMLGIVTKDSQQTSSAAVSELDRQPAVLASDCRPPSLCTCSSPSSEEVEELLSRLEPKDPTPLGDPEPLDETHECTETPCPEEDLWFA